MTARRKKARAMTPQDGNAPRLGTVIRFEPKAATEAIRGLEATGFQVASAGDFRSAASVPNDLGGAHVQYFERFGIAIVRQEAERLQGFLAKGLQTRVVRASRAERTYRALPRFTAPVIEEAAVALADAEYIAGYRDGVVQLADRILGVRREDGATDVTVARFDESLVTWGLQAIKADIARLSGRGIRVAVLDTGFDETHPDFRGRSVTKKLFATRSSTGDTHGHGTHCIGTACGPRTPASVPRYGVAYEAEIFAGKVLGDDGFGTDRSIIAGLDWAVEQGCQVVSMSLGAATEEGDQPNEDYEQIGQVCLDAGTLVIAAAGNESRRPQHIAPVGSPANASTIMAVGAVDRRLRVASFSCGGINPNQAVDIAAPGVDILSSIPGGGHERMNGTSMATPHVSGVAALLAESNPAFRGWALWARLEQITTELNAKARDVGKGLLQAPTG